MLLHRISSVVAVMAIAPFALAEVNNSTVESVTLYVDGARVLRSAQLNLEPGTQSVLIDVPASKQWNQETLQVFVPDDGSVRILGFSVEHVENAPEPGSLRAQIEALTTQKTPLVAQRKTAHDMAKNLSKVIADADLEQLVNADMLAVFAQAQAGINSFNAQAQALTGQIGELNDQIEMLSKQIADDLVLRENLGVRLEVDAIAGGEATFALAYLVQSARWAPTYEMNLTSDGLELAQNAKLTQMTMEDWEDIDVLLSTAKAFANTQMPDLISQRLFTRNQDKSETWQPVNFDSRFVGHDGFAANGISIYGDSLTITDNARHLVQVASPRQAVSSNQFVEIPLSSAIDLDHGQEGRNVTLRRDVLDVELSRRTTPILDSNVYLFGEITNETNAAIVGGSTTIFVDGRFAGQGRLDAIQPGESAEVALGQDQRVSVTRRLLDQTTGDRGLFRGKQRFERSYIFEMTSYHDKAIELQIFDRVPVAEDEEIEIKLLETTPEPAEIDVENRKGVMRWNVPLQPGVEAELNFGFEVLQPQDYPTPSL